MPNKHIQPAKTELCDVLQHNKLYLKKYTEILINERGSIEYRISLSLRSISYRTHSFVDESSLPLFWTFPLFCTGLNLYKNSYIFLFPPRVNVSICMLCYFSPILFPFNLFAVSIFAAEISLSLSGYTFHTIQSLSEVELWSKSSA